MSTTNNKVLVSEETHLRLQRELEELIDFTSNSDGSVGSAVKVVYDKEFSDQYGIGRFGRMTLKEGKRVFHAGSREIDQKPMFKFTKMEYAHLGPQFRDGKEMQISLDKVVATGEWPVPAGGQSAWTFASIERKLFKSLGNVITLVNPSFRTMNALDAISSQVSGAYVYLTNTHDVSYTKGVYDFVQKSNWLKMTEKIQGVSYLGSGQPNYFPPTPWIRLIPSPYILPNSEFQQYVAHWNEDGYSCSYERKPGYFVNNLLRFDVTTYVYNPETVDETFRDVGRPAHLAFMESSVPLKVTETDQRRIYHKPRFITIPLDAEWKQVGDNIYRVSGKIIYDVKGTGTYFSRRGRDTPPLMYHWCPYESHGSHWLTLSSLRPRRDYNISVKSVDLSTFICFGNTVPVRLERVLSNQFVLIDENEAPTVIRAVTDLKAPPIERTLPPRPWRNDLPSEASHMNGTVRYEYWKDSNGFVYPRNLRREDSIAWLHQLNQIPGLPTNLSPEPELKTLPRFVGNSGVSFVDVTGLPQGTYYLCPDRQYLVNMIPQAARYYSRNYLNIFTYGPYSKCIEIDGDEYQSKYNSEWNSIITEFKKKMVSNIGDNAKMEITVSDTLGLPPSIVSRYVRLHPDMFLWKCGVEGSGQWVHRDSLLLRFPEDDPMRGKFWTEVLDSRGVHVCKHDVGDFRKFCLNNGYSFTYEETRLDQVCFRVGKRR
jgi:hypothetical protein